MLVLCFNIFNHTGDGGSGCGSYIETHATLAAQTQHFLQLGYPATHGRLSLPALGIQHFFQYCRYVQALESREDRFKATLLKRWVYNPIAN